MDDMINRNAPIAEENIDPNGRPAIDKFEEWSEEVSEDCHWWKRERTTEVQRYRNCVEARTGETYQGN